MGAWAEETNGDAVAGADEAALVEVDVRLDVGAEGVALTGGGVSVGGLAAILMTAGAGAIKAGVGGVSFDDVDDSLFSDLMG